MTVTPLGRDQDCSLKNREPDVPASWFLDPGGWSKTAAVRLYFIFPGICTLSLREDVILEWIFLPRKPNKKLKTYIEKISNLIHKDSQSLAQCFAVDLCICFYQLLNDSSMMIIRVVTNLITREGQFRSEQPTAPPAAVHIDIILRTRKTGS
ncbi:hypothetical protein STEG23_038279 [Scotinomys teguina]